MSDNSKGVVVTPSGRKLKPSAERIVVKAVYTEAKTSAGIIIPEKADCRNYTQKGMICVFGENGGLQNCDLSDYIYFVRGIGEYTRRYCVDHEDYYIFESKDVLAKVRADNTLEACNSFIICEDTDKVLTTPSGLIIPRSKTECQLVRIVAMPEDSRLQDHIAAGDEVYISFSYPFTHDQKQYFAVPEYAFEGVRCE